MSEHLFCLRWNLASESGREQISGDRKIWKVKLDSTSLIHAMLRGEKVMCFFLQFPQNTSDVSLNNF